jgi:type VI secretion system protein ImpC
MEEPRFIGMSITSDPDETRFEPAVKGEGERESLDQLRLFVVADLNPAAAEPDWEAGDHTILLDSADLDSVLRELRPSIEVSVTNYLGGEGPRIPVDITVDAMAAFTPDGLAARVPLIRSARLMRDALRDARAGKVDRGQLQHRLEEAGMRDDTAAQLVAALAPRQPGSEGGPAGGDALARILGLVDFDGNTAPASSAPSAAGSALDSLVKAVSEQPADVDREEVDRALGDLERRLGAQIASIFEDAEFRRLEAAWRGLKFLADRAHFRGGIRLQVLPASRDQLPAALHHQVLMPEYESGSSRAPLAAVVIDHAFGASARDLEELEELAALGASLQVPVVTSVDAEFFGYDQPTDLSRLAVLRQHLATDTYIRFRKLRERPDAQFLALALPSFVLREQHEGAGWREASYLWGGGALLAAAAILGSHREAGWPTHLGDRRVENLVVRKTRMGALPLAASFADRMAAELAESGFLAFRAPLNRDHAMAAFPATVKRPEASDPAGARAQATLSSAVFSALAAHRILRVQDELAGMDAAEASAELDRRMRSFLGAGDLPEDAVTIQELDEHETADARVFGVRLRPPRKVLAHEVGLVLGATIAKGEA